MTNGRDPGLVIPEGWTDEAIKEAGNLAIVKKGRAGGLKEKKKKRKIKPPASKNDDEYGSS